MSDWTHVQYPKVNIQVGGRDWTPEVRHLCETIGYDLKPDQYDQGETGRCHACHAEKHLIAYFVNKHLFLSHQVKKHYDLVDPDLDQLSDEEFEHKGRLFNLKGAMSPVFLANVTILVCRPICGDSTGFVQMVNDALGLNIKVFHHCLEFDCRRCRNQEYAENNSRKLLYTFAVNSAL